MLQHQAHQVPERGPGLPVEVLAGLGCIATVFFNLGRPEVAFVDPDLPLPVEADKAEATSHSSRTECVSLVAIT